MCVGPDLISSVGELLQLRALTVELPTGAGWVKPVNDVSLGIARALILHPKPIVADEPVSALDVSAGAQVLRLLPELQQEFSLTHIFISHSLPVVAQLAARIAVMRAGQFEESGPAEQILREPRSPYTPTAGRSPEEPRPAKV